MSTVIIIAHYGLDRKITKEECMKSLQEDYDFDPIFIDFESGNSPLAELYSLPFENVALMQQRKFNEILKPYLDDNPEARIAYFGLVPIPVGFHLGVLVGNLHPYSIYQWHHSKHLWFKETEAPSDYSFEVQLSDLPKEVQRGKGEVSIRVSTSFNVDPQATYEVVPAPANEFDIALRTPHVDSLYSQSNINAVVNEFQRVIDSYSNKLKDRDKIHLFIASSAGLPFALGTRINPTVCPFVQTYQFDRSQTPKYREAIFISKEDESRPFLSDEARKIAADIRLAWSDQLEKRIKPFITTISGNQSATWLETICDQDQYKKVSKNVSYAWQDVPGIKGTSLKDDKIDQLIRDVDDGFEYTEKTNAWSLDDGFLFGLKVRLDKNPNTDFLQAGRLFFFHEALHYSKNGHSLTKEVATGIGQFPKVIEEADYQADVWALLTEYKYSSIYESDKLKDGIKIFFCNAIETAVETMWSFVDNGSVLTSFQIRSMNRFLNWYWQWLKIESLDGTGTLPEVICILFQKPVIEFAGAPMDLKAHRTYYKLNVRNTQGLQLAAFEGNKVYRFASPTIEDIVKGFRTFNGEKIKSGLKGFQLPLPTTRK